MIMHSLTFQWLRLLASTVGATSSIPGHGTMLPVAWRARKENKTK